MKNYPNLFILILLALIACQEDDNKPRLSDRELLTTYDWITYTVERDPDFNGEPDLILVVWSFTESTFTIGDFTGTFYERGEWTLEDNVLTIDEDEVMIIELTEEKLVYENRQGTIITRLPVKKIER